MTEETMGTMRQRAESLCKQEGTLLEGLQLFRTIMTESDDDVPPSSEWDRRPCPDGGTDLGTDPLSWDVAQTIAWQTSTSEEALATYREVFGDAPDNERFRALAGLLEPLVRSGSPELVDTSLRSLATKGPCLIQRMDGFIKLTGLCDENAYVETLKEYQPPFMLKIKARTDGTSIRIEVGGVHAIFNWEYQKDLLSVINIPTGRESMIPKNGDVSENEWHEIAIRVTGDREFEISVDGDRRYWEYRMNENKLYANNPTKVSVGPGKLGTVDIESVEVEQL